MDESYGISGRLLVYYKVCINKTIDFKMSSFICKSDLMPLQNALIKTKYQKLNNL